MYKKKIEELHNTHKQLIAECQDLSTEIINNANKAFTDAFPGNTFTITIPYGMFYDDPFVRLSHLKLEISAMNDCTFDKKSRQLIKCGISYYDVATLIKPSVELDEIQELAFSLSEEYGIEITVKIDDIARYKQSSSYDYYAYNGCDEGAVYDYDDIYKIKNIHKQWYGDTVREQIVREQDAEVFKQLNETAKPYIGKLDTKETQKALHKDLIKTYKAAQMKNHIKIYDNLPKWW